MRVIHAARARLALLFGRRADDRMDAEIAFHIEMETARLVREEGLGVHEAARRARVAFGGVQQHKETLRDGRGLSWLGGLSLDFKLGARMLVKYPGLTIVAVLGMSVAVAIGAVSFSAIYSVLDAKLPFDAADRIVALKSQDVNTGESDRTQLYDFETWREALPAVQELSAYRTVDRNLITRDRRYESVIVVEMTASGFRVPRVPPLMGRYFDASDEARGAPPVVVIGYDVWQTRFTGSANVIGQTVWLDASAYTIIGVMPQGFAFPINNRVWTPLQLRASTFTHDNAPLVKVFGRLAPGATLSDAQRQLSTISQRLTADYPTTHQHLRPRVVPYTQLLLDSPDLVWLFHLAQLLISMLLVVIGTNVAVLVYARTASRAGEIAVRIALGASRNRVVAQLFVEALVLSTLAAAAGLAIAHVSLQQLSALLSPVAEQVPFWLHFGITPGVVVYVAGLAVLGAAVIGVVPALKATRSRVHANLQLLGSAGAAVRIGRSWTVMVVAQVAVAVVGIPIGTVALRGIRVTVEPRFAASQFIVARLFMDDVGQQPGDSTAAARFVNLRSELARRLAAEPGVTRVVFSSGIPGAESDARYEVEGSTIDGKREAPTNRGFRTNAVEPAFFDAFDIPILMGRGFTAGDASSSSTPVIVNQSFADSYLAGTNPLGRRVRAFKSGQGDGTQWFPWQTIVGVVPDFPALSDTSVAVAPRLYWPLQPNDAHAVAINVRVAGKSLGGMVGRLRELTLAVSPSLRLARLQTFIDNMNDAMAPTQLGLTAVLLVVLSVLFLSTAGMYALMSLMVTRRRREIGIRAALGAGARQVIMSVLARAAAQIGIGVGVGVFVLFLIVAGPHGGKVSLPEFYDLLAVVGLIVVVGLFAAVGPAWRAMQIQPTEALKAE
ncbi:MAG TPA: ABC transporter permease [Gemmatimonadaceae bacterium]|jgi:predicted permease